MVSNLSILTRLRTERGLTQSQLGDHVGVANKAISSLELGKSRVRPQTAVRILEELHFQGPLSTAEANELLQFIGLGSAVWERIQRSEESESMTPKEARGILNHVLHRVGLETFAALANGVLADAHAAQMQVVKVVQPPERGIDGQLYQVTKVMPKPQPSGVPAQTSTLPRGTKKAK